jgi:hypothetical protein
VRERGTVDVRKDGELKPERGEACERRGRVWEDRPFGERGCEHGGCGRMLRGVTRDRGRWVGVRVRLWIVLWIARARDDRAIGDCDVESTTSGAGPASRQFVIGRGQYVGIERGWALGLKIGLYGRESQEYVRLGPFLALGGRDCRENASFPVLSSPHLGTGRGPKKTEPTTRVP